MVITVIKINVMQQREENLNFIDRRIINKLWLIYTIDV